MSAHRIGIASRRSGVGIETIRYYEREGIVPKPERAVSGRRLYDEDAIARLRFVRRCRELGFSMKDAMVLLALSNDSGYRCLDVKRISENHLLNIESKILDLKKLSVALVELIDRCDNEQVRCPALEQLFSE